GQGSFIRTVELHLFTVGRMLTSPEIEDEFQVRRLRPDFYAQMELNRSDYHLADRMPNGMQWRDSQGRFCCASYFSMMYIGPVVDAGRYDGFWYSKFWFAGVPAL